MRKLLTILIIGLLCCFHQAKAQQSSDIIIGNVFAKGEGGLIGVSVKEIDATKRIVSGTTTDINGDFSLRIKSNKNKLEVSYLGFKTQTLTIGDKKNFSIELKEDDFSLDEVTISAKKMANTGTMAIPEREVSMAMQTITAAFDELSVASIDEALQGQVAGLDIVANSGDVGAGSAMRLRGTASINANVTPLIVVNDLIYDAGNTDHFDFVNASEENYANLLSINVDDIESLSFAKDGSSTAMWGSRGANGVIYIRTRKGSQGAPKIKYSYRFSQQWQPEGMKMLTGDEYTMYLKEAYFNPNFDVNASNIKEISYRRDFDDWRMFEQNIDWVDAVKTTGNTHDHYLTLSGGGEKATFYLSGGYFKKTGAIIGQNLDRFTTRMDLDYFVSDRILFRSEMAFTYTNEDKNYVDNDKNKSLLATAYGKMPNLSIYRLDDNGNNTGEYYALPQDLSSVFNDDQRKLWNPVAVANLAKNNVKSYKLNPIFKLQYDLLPREQNQMLRLAALVSFDISNNSSHAFMPKELSSAIWTDGSLNKSDKGNSKSNSTLGRITINWVPKISNESHSISLYAAGEISLGSNSWQSQKSYGIPSGIESPSTGSYPSEMGSGSGSWRGLNFLTTGHYSYQSKYNLDFSYRREGSSKFGPNRRYGDFYGLSVRWNIIDESFMESTRSWLSMLAIRASTGLTGNQPNDEYLHFSRYQSWSSYLGVSTIRPTSIRLNDLRWEKTRDYNLGFNLGFLEDHFTADFNYYDRRTSDLLHKDVSIPTTSGFAQYTYQNVGSMKNEGWELYMNLNRFIEIGKFSADFNLNFSNNVNTILELDDVVLAKYNPEFNRDNGSYMSRLQLNNSFGSIYGFRYKGVYTHNVDTYMADPELQNNPLCTAPVARDVNGNVIMDSEGKAVPMYFSYGTTAQMVFQGGDAIYEDINNDGNINELDIVYLGNSNPKFNGGMGFKFKYDRLSLNIFTVFRYGNKIINAARMNAENMHSNYNQSRAINWRWRKEGDGSDGSEILPRALRNAGRNFLGSDRFVEDGSFLRINQVSINYSLPKSLLSKASISSANVYLTLYNLFCFSGYSGVDPEVGYGSWGVSMDSNQTPRSKSFTAGISLNF